MTTLLLDDYTGWRCSIPRLSLTENWGDIPTEKNATAVLKAPETVVSAEILE